MTRKPRKYDHNQYTWHHSDWKENCAEKVVECPAGYKGHIGFHLNQNVSRKDSIGNTELQVIKYVMHSHFTHETDKGRHVICEIGRTWILSSHCKLYYRMKKPRELPEWIRKQLYG